MVEASLSDYATSLLGGEDAVLRAMREEAEQQGLPAIQVSEDLGRLLQATILMSGTKSILEIGALFGYSSLLMARVLPPDGHITSLELDHRHATIARRNLDRAGVGALVDVREGNALDTLATLSGPFDLVFIDADKPSYPQYLDAATRLTQPGGIIIADNLWRGGTVLHPDDDTSRAIAAFNERIAQDPRLFSIFVGHRDCSDAASISYRRS